MVESWSRVDQDIDRGSIEGIDRQLIADDVDTFDPEPQSNAPAKKTTKECSSSMSEQNASDNEDCQTLMEKIAQECNESDSESENEILAEMQKEYEAEDSITLPSSLVKCFAVA